LVKAGANVEAKANNGGTPLILASTSGHLTTVKFLVEEGHANVEAKDKEDGYTPLIWASGNGDLTTVKFLVEEGHANVEAKDNDGSTALGWAKMCGERRVVAYLRSKGATE
jgi:FOG: Ankyrin repeat